MGVHLDSDLSDSIREARRLHPEISAADAAATTREAAIRYGVDPDSVAELGSFAAGFELGVGISGAGVLTSGLRPSTEAVALEGLAKFVAPWLIGIGVLCEMEGLD